MQWDQRADQLPHLANEGDGGVDGVLDSPADRLARAVLVVVVLVVLLALALLLGDAVSLLVLKRRSYTSKGPIERQVICSR